MKAIRTELLPLEVITGFLPPKPPNRMLRYYMQFPSLICCLSIGEAISIPLWFMQNTNPSGTNGSKYETINDSFHFYAPFFLTWSNPSWWNSIKCNLVAWLLDAIKSSDHGWCPYLSVFSMLGLQVCLWESSGHWNSFKHSWFPIDKYGSQEHRCQVTCVIGTAPKQASWRFIPKVEFSELKE